ncbi:hypothetical protein KIPB_011869, partial [Kipferlia bialata]
AVPSSLVKIRAVDRVLDAVTEGVEAERERERERAATADAKRGGRRGRGSNAPNERERGREMCEEWVLTALWGVVCGYVPSTTVAREARAAIYAVMPHIIHTWERDRGHERMEERQRERQRQRQRQTPTDALLSECHGYGSAHPARAIPHPWLSMRRYDLSPPLSAASPALSEILSLSSVVRSVAPPLGTTPLHMPPPPPIAQAVAASEVRARSLARQALRECVGGVGTGLSERVHTREQDVSALRERERREAEAAEARMQRERESSGAYKASLDQQVEGMHQEREREREREAQAEGTVSAVPQSPLPGGVQASTEEVAAARAALEDRLETEYGGGIDSGRGRGSPPPPAPHPLSQSYQAPPATTGERSDGEE